MKLTIKLPTYLIILITGLLLSFYSCEKDDPLENNKHVNNWIYEQMNIYYFWNNKILKSPNYTQTPKSFFNSLLNKYDSVTNPNGDRFSWIQENYIDLLNSLSGVSSDDIGFEYVPVSVGNGQYYLLVLYPKLGSDAEAQGVRKGRFVIKIDGNDIYENNLKSLVSGTGVKTLTMVDWVYNAEKGEYQLMFSGHITVQMHKNFAETPVYFDHVYTTPNGKKVGYLVYNFFAADKGDNSHDYDKLLINTLNKIKSNGATEFILDLRYNGGGSLSTTIALASALVPNRSTSSLFGYTEYNPLLQAEYEKEYEKEYGKDGKDAFKYFFIDAIRKVDGTKIIDIPSLGFSKIYVLTSQWTASASELIINGLKPYMEVIIIGEQTVGKNVGSISIYEKNNPKNKWGIQPIVSKFFNSKGESDYTAGFVPDHKVTELDDYLQLVSFGDTDDKLLNKALSLINGAPLKPTPARAPKIGTSGLRLLKVSESASIQEKPAKNVLNDDVRGEDIRKLLENKTE